MSKLSLTITRTYCLRSFHSFLRRECKQNYSVVLYQGDKTRFKDLIGQGAGVPRTEWGGVGGGVEKGTERELAPEIYQKFPPLKYLAIY